MLVGAMLYELRFEAREIVNLPILNLLSHLVVLYVYIYAHPKFKMQKKIMVWKMYLLTMSSIYVKFRSGGVHCCMAFTQCSNLGGIAVAPPHGLFSAAISRERSQLSIPSIPSISLCQAWCWPIGRNGIWQRCCNVMEWMQRYQGSGNINQQILQRKYQSKVHMQVHQWSTCVLTVCVLLIFVGNCVAISDAESSKPTHQSDWVKFCSSITTWRRSSGLNAFLHKRPRWLGRLQYVHEAHENCLSISL